MTNEHARIHEIFSSLQGEGPYTSVPMTFIRFQGCSLRCQWCDTKESLPTELAEFRVEFPEQLTADQCFPNPASIETLNDILTEFSDDTYALTGGEPLEQARFLAQWLPTVAPNKRILLETAGIHTSMLRMVLPYLDIVSMDIKLPSSTGMRAYWDQHRSFIHAVLGAEKQIYIKSVITKETQLADLDIMTTMIASIDPNIPVYLQPASPTDDYEAEPSSDNLQELLALCERSLGKVLVRAQMHKEWGIR